MSNITAEQIKTVCEMNGWEGRKHRDKVIKHFLGIDYETARTAETINRYLRDLYPIDEVGEKKEAEYHMPTYLRNFSKELGQIKINLY